MKQKQEITEKYRQNYRQLYDNVFDGVCVSLINYKRSNKYKEKPSLISVTWR
ncbi:MAG: hypothetical protein ACTSQE_03880 [Candidatus Heimdallarchaeaceae archaeon]